MPKDLLLGDSRRQRIRFDRTKFSQIFTAVIYVIDPDERRIGLLRDKVPARFGEVESYSSHESCLASLRHDQPACLLVDLIDLNHTNIEGSEGSIFRRIADFDDVPGLVVLADQVSVPQTVSLLHAGALNVIVRPISSGLLEAAIDHAHSESERRLAEAKKIREFRLQWRSLQEQEREVARLLLQGLTSEAIATRTGASTRTVDRRRRAILDAMNEQTMTELAYRLGRHDGHW